MECWEREWQAEEWRYKSSMEGVEGESITAVSGRILSSLLRWDTDSLRTSTSKLSSARKIPPKVEDKI